MPIFYASPTRITVQVAFDIVGPGGRQGDRGRQVASINVMIQIVAPGIVHGTQCALDLMPSDQKIAVSRIATSRTHFQ